MSLLPGVLALVGAPACAASSSDPQRREIAQAPAEAATAVATPPPAPPSAPAEPPSNDAGAGEAGAAQCEAAERVDVAAPLRPLFEKGRRFRYLVTDDVDPHAPDGRRSVAKVKVDCVVSSLCRFGGGAVSSTITCTEPEGRAVLASGELGFLASDGALWMPSSLPTDDAAVRRALAETPVLPATPARSRRTYDQPGMHDGTRDTCTEVVEVSGALMCRDVRCAVKAGYGNTQDRTCLSPTRGLASRRRVNLEGPRTSTWELLDSSPAAKP